MEQNKTDLQSLGQIGTKNTCLALLNRDSHEGVCPYAPKPEAVIINQKLAKNRLGVNARWPQCARSGVFGGRQAFR